MKNNNTLPSQVKVRDSNMELLRIVAMLLVMVVHANFRALPVPGMAWLHAHPSSGFLMFMTEGFSIVAVDLFVLLSGWYGIKPRLNRFAELVFQVLFFGLVAIAGCAIFVPADLHPTSSVFSRLFLLGDFDYWFVKAYIAMYLFAPALNTFVEHATRRQFATVLLSFLAFQCIYGWLWEGTKWFVAGYSAISFMWLYLLARYVRLHPVKWLWQRSKWFDLAVYLGCVAFFTIAMFVIKWYGGRGGFLYFYNCPIVIVSALHLLLFFSKISLRSRLINWVAVSAFAIYLTHSSSFIGKYYDVYLLQWFNQCSRADFIGRAVLLIVGVFIASILLDKLRLLLWRPLNDLLFKR